MCQLSNDLSLCGYEQAELLDIANRTLTPEAVAAAREGDEPPLSTVDGPRIVQLLLDRARQQPPTEDDEHAASVPLLPPSPVSDTAHSPAAVRTTEGHATAGGGAFGNIPSDTCALHEGARSRRGRRGVKDLLHAMLKTSVRAPPQTGVRIHLVGHSFGCRVLLTACSLVRASADPPPLPHSILLIQPAISRWAFSPMGP